MSSAALETLAVIAYRQPATRQEVDEIRGVASGGVIKTLLDKGYLKVAGRRDEPGRPLEYGTTALFLEMFELDNLSGLPTLAEREELAEAQEPEGLPINPLADSGTYDAALVEGLVPEPEG
jgi:segregation and condensation protein B